MPVICPAMVLVVLPVTRLRIADWAVGCTNRTVSPAPTEKLFQSTMARLLVWVTVVVLPLVAIPALPAATRPPCGNTACACTVPALSSAELASRAVTKPVCFVLLFVRRAYASAASRAASIWRILERRECAMS